MKFVPTPQDYLKNMKVEAWMCNGVKDVNNPEATLTAKELKERLPKIKSGLDLEK